MRRARKSGGGLLTNRSVSQSVAPYLSYLVELYFDDALFERFVIFALYIKVFTTINAGCTVGCV